MSNWLDSTTVTTVDPTCPSYLGKSETVSFREAEQAKTRKHVLNDATMVSLFMSPLGTLGAAAEGFLQNFATVACSTGVVGRDVWLRTSRQYLSCAPVRGRGIVFCRYFRSLSQSAMKDFVMVQLCHLNDFGIIELRSKFAIRILALLFAFELVCHFD
jgi:hypothetical protein